MDESKPTNSSSNQKKHEKINIEKKVDNQHDMKIKHKEFKTISKEKTNKINKESLNTNTLSNDFENNVSLNKMKNDNIVHSNSKDSRRKGKDFHNDSRNKNKEKNKKKVSNLDKKDKKINSDLKNINKDSNHEKEMSHVENKLKNEKPNNQNYHLLNEHYENQNENHNLNLKTDHSLDNHLITENKTKLPSDFN